MAKPKRQNRISQKRAKRRQRQKTKHKENAIRKHEISQSSRSAEDQIQERILESRKLVSENEFSDLTIDPEIIKRNLIDFFDQVYREESSNSLGIIAIKFQREIFTKFITEDYVQSIRSALRGIEVRLRRIGRQEDSENAFITRSLFEIAELDSILVHPLIVGLFVRQLRQLLTAPDFPTVEYHIDTHLLVQELLEINESDLDPDKIEKHSFDPTAKALYKNFDLARTQEQIERDYIFFESENEMRKYVNTNNDAFIILTRDRVEIQSETIASLKKEMDHLEQLCGESIFYLAKTCTTREGEFYGASP